MIRGAPGVIDCSLSAPPAISGSVAPGLLVSVLLDASTKRFSENMQQVYQRTLPSKCDFNKVAKQFH